MTLLPIVERELRVAARRRGTYRSRWLMAVGALLVGGAMMAWCDFFAPAGLVSQQEVGSYIFWGLAGLSLLYCALAGRFSTADCLSIEKREGTLGLLFLTDLRGYDVVLGKLAATSVQAFYGLLAVFPALAIPLLMGGVTSGEFWRVVLVLVDTFLFSLAVGLFASARARTYERAMAWNFSLMGSFIVIPVLLWMAAGVFFSNPWLFEPVFLFCPVFTLICSADGAYHYVRLHYWFSVGVFHLLTWILVLRASRIVPNSWQEKSPESNLSRKTARTRAEVKGGRARGGSPARAAFRKKCLDVSATFWLASRPGNKPVQVWIFMVVAGLWWLGLRLCFGRVCLDEIPCLVAGMLLNLSLKLWVTLEAGGWLARDKKAGAFELLLPTPLTVRDMIRGQLISLRRQFLGPLLLAMVVEFLLAAASADWRASDTVERYWTWGVSMFMLVADLVALTGVAMVDALTVRNVSRAPIKTATRVLVLPWLILTLVTAINILLYRDEPLPWRWHPSWTFLLIVWMVGGLWADVFFGAFAWRRLLTQFRELAAGESDPKTARQTAETAG